MARDGTLDLGHVLAASGVTDVSDLVVLRHVPSDELASYGGATPAGVLAYTRAQRGNKLPERPAGTWLVFLAAGGRRSRFFGGYDNHGEVPEERTADLRFFDLRPSDLMSALAHRLVVEWSKDTINWAKPGPGAATFPVVEIADPEVVEFPGFDRVLISYAELQDVVGDARYARWRAALGSVQGVYLIADTATGRSYVGKADGRERILGRWSAYARDGHGGNVALRELAGLDPNHARRLVFSILRVFSPTALGSDVDAAEAHYKRALLTREFGYNRN